MRRWRTEKWRYDHDIYRREALSVGDQTSLQGEIVTRYYGVNWLETAILKACPSIQGGDKTSSQFAHKLSTDGCLALSKTPHYLVSQLIRNPTSCVFGG